MLQTQNSNTAILNIFDTSLYWK